MQCESSGNGGDYERWEGAAKQTQITRRQLPVDLEFQNFICFLHYPPCLSHSPPKGN